MIIRKRILGLMLATACSLGANAAIAADYEPPVFEAPADDEYVPVEIGSGWYLRGDVTYSFERGFKDYSIFADDFIADNDLIGVGWLGPLDLFSFKEEQLPVHASIGAGYHFNDYLRADVTLGISSTDRVGASGNLFPGYTDGTFLGDWRNAGPVPDFGCLGQRTTSVQNLNPDGTPNGAPVVTVDPDWRRNCIVTGEGQSSNFDGMVNGYVDLGTFAGVTPYLGAGVGMVYTKVKFSASADCNSQTIVESTAAQQTTSTFTCRDDDPHVAASYDEKNYNLVYGLMAGLAYKMTNNVSLDVGYQYKNIPNLEYLTISQDGVRAGKGYDSHQVKVGLRYDLW